MTKKPALIFSIDTETGGFNPRTNALLTIGVAWKPVDEDKPIKKKEWRIKNDYKVVDKAPDDMDGRLMFDNIFVETKALEINKLDLEDLKSNGESLKVIDTQIVDLVDELSKEYSVQLLGQNIKFDLGFISSNLPNTYARLNKLVTHHELRSMITCYHLFKAKDYELFFGEAYNKSTSLDNVRKELNIESSGQTHSSAVDAEDTLNVFLKILYEMYGTDVRNENPVCSEIQYNPSIVQIGNKLWMKENLDYDDGEEGITYNPKNKEYYYTWDAAKRVAKKLLGWRIPTAEDWNEAAEECGDICTNPDEEDIAFRDYEGGNLKEKLKVNLAGYYSENFYDVGSYANFWTSSDEFGTIAYGRYFSTSASMDSDYYNKNCKNSVRLVKEI